VSAGGVAFRLAHSNKCFEQAFRFEQMFDSGKRAKNFVPPYELFLTEFLLLKTGSEIISLGLFRLGLS
jgi:hypothetical protein